MQLGRRRSLTLTTVALLALGLAGCPGEPPPIVDDGGRMDAASSDAASSDAAAEDTAADPVDSGSLDDAPPADAGACAEPPSPEVAALRPIAGELFYAQIGLGGLSIGESAILVGPDGTVVVIDAGNGSHDDDIADALLALTGASVVDHVVVTHFHADHGDGLADLLDRVTLRGRIVHRGFTDLTAAANDATVDTVCGAIAAHPGSGAPLCEASTSAPCTGRVGTYPAVACAGLASADLALGAGARLDFLAANGFIDGDRFETVVGPIRTDDSNGENARSVVGLIAHGAFRMLVAGDLTGGGSDTDDLESFYASRLAGVGVPALGVDVLHASHHGRDTSSNPTWVARLLPSDGRSRNVVMGISTAHLRSPHASVLATLLDGGRLADGRAWTTTVAAGGATAPELIDADGGLILLRTLEGGAAYAIQAIDASGAVLESRAYRSLSACP